ncbi:MAG: SGNH/GDSL hydrolase family protein [Deltaproteobacteria bacterium]|jgi:hypothetical protein|nr:SGNH/GDSL hydrolase family protein [Deltaproteobacteria bacterium]
MKKEWLLLIGSVSLTLITAIFLVRWFAPQLLGIPIDLQMVKVNKKIPPFFDGVFRPDDYGRKEYMLPDPHIIRAKPLSPFVIDRGPNDLLGFRNRNIPNIADVITIGDSHTYGNNTLLELNWPSIMVKNFEQLARHYNMSVGGWGAAEYFEIFNKALYFQPRMVVIAFYTGNDPIETFIKVYGDKRWKSLRLNPGLSSADSPDLLEDREWKVQFQDGTEITFTPHFRYVSNRRDNLAVLTGYEIMGEIAKKIAEIATQNKITLVFTVIPTKELVYKKRIISENITLREDYAALVRDEEKNLSDFAEKLKNIQSSWYIDLLAPLQQAALDIPHLYPSEKNGHPLSNGYKIIGETLAKGAAGLLPQKTAGLFYTQYFTDDNEFYPYLVKENRFYLFSSKNIMEKNGWDSTKITKVDLRDISKLSFGGIINTVDPSQYGPSAFH